MEKERQERAKAQRENERAEEMHQINLRLAREALQPASLPTRERADSASGGAKQGAVTLDSSRDYLPASAVKALRTQAPPIADASIPEPTSLRSFWERVDHALRSLDPSFARYKEGFTRQHVQLFGLHLVGFEGWQ